MSMTGFEPATVTSHMAFLARLQLAIPAHPKHKAAVQEIWRLRFANKLVYPDKVLLDMWAKAECPPTELQELVLEEIRKRELDI